MVIKNPTNSTARVRMYQNGEIKYEFLISPHTALGLTAAPGDYEVAIDLVKLHGTRPGDWRIVPSEESEGLGEMFEALRSKDAKT